MISRKALETLSIKIQEEATKTEQQTEKVVNGFLQYQTELFFDLILSRLILASKLRNSIDTLIPVEAESNTYINILRACEQTLAYYDVPHPMSEDEEYDYPSIQLQADILSYALRDLAQTAEIEKQLKREGYKVQLCQNRTLIRCQYFLKIYL